MHQWLDRAPLGRNEPGGLWWKRRGEYPASSEGVKKKGARESPLSTQTCRDELGGVFAIEGRPQRLNSRCL